MGSVYPPVSYPFPPAKTLAQWMAPSAAPSHLSAFNSIGQTWQTPEDQAIIGRALSLLGQIRNLPQDEAYINRLGIYPGFRNGQQALQVIQSKGIQVEFGDMGDSPAHAQWISDQNKIMINQRYKGDTSPATLYAISEAIYHEAGHAAGNGDGESSVQEELNCLALNTLAYRYHAASDPAYAQSSSTNRLLADGVALYPKLFFDPDPQKKALVNRVVEKYGDLPLSSPGHDASPSTMQGWPMAYRVKQQYNQQSPFNPSPYLPLPNPSPSPASGGGFPMSGQPPRLSYQA